MKSFIELVMTVLIVFSFLILMLVLVGIIIGVLF